MTLNKKELEDFNKEMDEVFKTTPSTPLSQYTDIEAVLEKTTIKNKIKTKKLKIVGWIAAVLSLIGIMLNAYKIILCWPVWCVANIFWIYWATKKKEKAQIFLWIVFTLANLYGWFLWATM